MPRDEDPPLFCDRCSKALHPGRGEFYEVRIDAVADPSPPIINEEDLDRDIGLEIERLIATLNDMTEREALDQVHRRLTLYLCNACYRLWIENPTGT